MALLLRSTARESPRRTRTISVRRSAPFNTRAACWLLASRCNGILAVISNPFAFPDIGANASAEEASEALESEARTVIDVVDAFNLSAYTDPNGQKFYGTFKEYRTYFGGRLLIRPSLH